MPHKRAKRSVREAERRGRETDLAPTPLANEPIPKGVARVLGAEAVRGAYRARRAAEAGEKEKGKSLKPGGAGEGIRPGETLGEYNRRVEETHRPLVRAAMKHLGGKGKKSDKDPRARAEGAVKRKREQADEGERPVKEFQTFQSGAPRRLHDVALAPPTLTSAPRGAGATVGKTVSMARRVILEQERARAIEMYRARKRIVP
ncbi:hypothetical protein FRC06_007724 [Ceratobasidium sp. 370]|nr:hypothetical protein FRC06_007724 [Ceratobasidium sp. 370]